MRHENLSELIEPTRRLVQGWGRVGCQLVSTYMKETLEPDKLRAAINAHRSYGLTFTKALSWPFTGSTGGVGGLKIRLCKPELNGSDIEAELRRTPYAFTIAYGCPRSIEVDAFMELSKTMSQEWLAHVQSIIWSKCYTHNAWGYCFDTVFSPDLSVEEAVNGLKLLFTTSLRFIEVTTNDDKKEAGNWRSIMQHNEAFVRWKMEGYFDKTFIDKVFEISSRRRGE